MPWQVYAFVLLPCGAGAVLGLAVRRLGVALGAAMGAVALFLTVATFGVPLLRPAVPVLTGAIVAALALAVLLALRPGAGRLARVGAASGAALAAHLGYLHLALVAR
jgi:hypothetical protein